MVASLIFNLDGGVEIPPYDLGRAGFSPPSQLFGFDD
jgi:hypothetical protein